jgi:hypothetical protein
MRSKFLTFQTSLTCMGPTNTFVTDLFPDSPQKRVCVQEAPQAHPNCHLFEPLSSLWPRALASWLSCSCLLHWAACWLWCPPAFTPSSHLPVDSRACCLPVQTPSTAVCGTHMTALCKPLTDHSPVAAGPGPGGPQPT